MNTPKKGSRECGTGKANIRRTRLCPASAFSAQMKFASDLSLRKMVAIKPASHIYGSNALPYSRFIYRMKSRKSECYSPMVRNRRGLQRALTLFFRKCILLGAGSKLHIPYEAFHQACEQTGIDPNEMLETMKAQVSESTQIFWHYGGQAIVEKSNDTMLKQAAETMMLLLNALQQSSGIDKNLTGQDNNIEAAIALSEKRQDAQLGFTELLMHRDKAVETIGELMLANIEQFGSQVDWNAFADDDGEVVAFGNDGDFTIQGNRASYKVIADSRDPSASRETAIFLTEVVKRADEGTALSLAPTIVRHMGGTDAVKTARRVAKAINLNGGKVMPEDLPAGDREAYIQGQRAQQEELERNKKLAEEGAVSEIEKNAAEAEKNRADAEKKRAEAAAVGEEGGEEKGGDEDMAAARATIARLTREKRALESRQ